MAACDCVCVCVAVVHRLEEAARWGPPSYWLHSDKIMQKPMAELGSLLVLLENAAKRQEGDWLQMSSILQRSRTIPNSGRSSAFISSHQLPVILCSLKSPCGNAASVITASRHPRPARSAFQLHVSVLSLLLKILDLTYCWFASKEWGGLKIRTDPRKSECELLLSTRQSLKM